ncbi:hypothetical protein PCANB_002456 [Pneumocystis canis]|nr:hypothetical protein PCANB_002456 [Pneumocystis canis]
MSFFTKEGKFKAKNKTENMKYNYSFYCDELLNYGISDGIRLATYNSIQSLLAVATIDSKIYLFKDKNIKVRYSLPRQTLIQHLILHGNHLISIDSKNNLYSWSIDTTSIIPSAIYSTRGYVTCIETDPCIDWLYIGFKDGTIDVWDIDRECISPYKISNLYLNRYKEWHQMNYSHAPSKSHIPPVLCIQIHPRDVGTILIGYPDGAVLYSIKKNAVLYFFELEIPQRIHETNSGQKISVFRPKLTNLSWAPHGYHFLTSHQNGCFAFWSTKSNKCPLQVCTLDKNGVNTLLEKQIGSSTHDPMYSRNPIFSITWSCNDNLENTSVFIVGGNLNTQDSKELNILNFGQCPSISSTENIFSQYYTTPKQHIALSHFLSSNVVNICIFSKISPQYLGNYNTELILLILASGEVELLKYPDGIFLNSMKSLPTSLEWLSPKIHDASLCFVSKNNLSSQNTKYDKGYSEIYKSEFSDQSKLLNHNGIITTGHNNGIVRIYNVTQDHKFEKIHEIFLAETLNRLPNTIRVTITKLSETSEFIIGCEGGELIIYKFLPLKKKKKNETDNFSNPQTFKEFSDRYNDENLKSDNSKVSVFRIHRGSVISLKTSNIGLVACGYEFGTVILINLHKRTIIFQIELSEVKNEKKQLNLKNIQNNDENSELEVAVTFEFTIGKLKASDESVVFFIIGTSIGRLIFYSLCYTSKNELSSKYIGEVLFEDGSIINILPIFQNTFKPYVIYTDVFNSLKGNSFPENLIVVITEKSVKVFNSCFIEISHYYYEESIKCISANIIYQENIHTAVACVLNNKRVLFLSLSNLHPILVINLPPSVNNNIITMTGDLYLWVNETELSLFNLFGSGIRINEFSNGILYDHSKKAPPRPTISTWEWVLGTKYITIAELDLLIGGPNRPLPKKSIDFLEQESTNKTKKKMVSADQKKDYQENLGNVFTQTAESICERGKKILGIEEKLQSLEKSSINLLKSIQNYTDQQKSAIRKQALKGTIKGFFKYS